MQTDALARTCSWHMHECKWVHRRVTIFEPAYAHLGAVRLSQLPSPVGSRQGCMLNPWG